jgi:uncharacterized protein
MKGSERSRQIHAVIAVGTKVLVRSTGKVGVVTAQPAAEHDGYRIRFSDQTQAAYTRDELALLKQSQDPVEPVSQLELRRFVQFQCIVGSTAYGLAQEGSDVDRRGFYLPPAHLHWSLAGVPEQLESDEEEVYWELEKFLRLALKANPNVLETLYSPMVEKCAPIAQELVGMRQVFLSRYVHQTYNSYVLSQFKKLEQDVRNRGERRWKHVMHLIRLLLSALTVLREDFVPVRVQPYREQLLSIRRGEVPWEEVEEWRMKLHAELDQALASTDLPEHPDYAAANDFLIRARRLAAREDYA